MQSVGHLARNPHSRGIRGARWRSHFDQARRSISRHSKRQPGRPTHQDVRRLAIHMHHGQAKRVRAEIDAGYLDFAQRQCRRRYHIVHPRQWDRLRHGLM
jgi:hypothetical protein